MDAREDLRKELKRGLNGEQVFTLLLSFFTLAVVVSPVDIALIRFLIIVNALWLIYMSYQYEEYQMFKYFGLILAIIAIVPSFLDASLAMFKFFTRPPLRITEGEFGEGGGGGGGGVAPPPPSTGSDTSAGSSGDIQDLFSSTAIVVTFLLAVFSTILWVTYGDRGRIFKLTAMLISVTPPVAVFVYILEMGDEEFSNLLGGFGSIIQSLGFPPITFLVKSLVALIFFMGYLIVVIVVSVIASVLKSFL